MMKKFICLVAGVFYFSLAISLIVPALAQDQKVIVYCDDNYSPYSFKQNGQATGIYTDIFKMAFSRIKGYQVTIKPVPWKRGLSLLKYGKGFALYPPYYRPKARPYMDYPAPILDEGYDILCTQEIAAKNPKNWPEDFAGMKIGINAGFSIPDVEKAKALNIKIEEAKDNRSNLLKLASGRLDGYINDKNAMLWELKRLKKSGNYNEDTDKKLVVVTNISKEQGYMGFTNQDKGAFPFKQDFIKQFVTAINQMKQDGEIQEILDSYIK